MSVWSPENTPLPPICAAKRETPESHGYSGGLSKNGERDSDDLPAVGARILDRLRGMRDRCSRSGTGSAGSEGTSETN